MAETAYPFSCTSRRWLLGHRHASSSDPEGLRAVRLYPGRCARGEPPSLPSTRTIWQRAPVSLSPIQPSGAKPASYLSASMRQRATAGSARSGWSAGVLWAVVVLGSPEVMGWVLKEVCSMSDLSAESGQSSGQFQGRPSEVWSQWQSQHHGQQSGEPHSHQQPGQTEVFQVNQRAPPSRRYPRLLSASFPPRSLPPCCSTDC